MAVGGIGSFNTLTSYSGISNSKTNSELEFDKIYQQKTDSVEINSTAGNNDIMTIYEMLCSEFPEANYILEDRSDLNISKVIQKTYLSIDENGTEAAAATEINCGACANPPKPIELKFNRPFIYGIIDNKTNLPIFIGAINKL